MRRDLAVSRQRTAGGDCLVVKQPSTGRFFRFRDVERFIAEQLDGDTPLEVVRQRTEARFGATLPPATLDAFIRKLAALGLLDDLGAEEAEGKARRPSIVGIGKPPRVRGNVLYLRFSLVDPDRLLGRLVEVTRGLFTTRFVWTVVTAIAAALWITLANGQAIAHELGGLYHLSALPAFLALILVVASAHEFAHGLTCKHFGGEVHELGFMLMYFQPAFYCNVSDAWLFPEKSKRIWVGAAGPFFELFVWSLAVFIWRLTEADTMVHGAALIIMTISGVRSLLDLNPFVKLDGYYLLSDWLEIPNLRRRSFKYVGDLVKRVAGFDTPVTDLSIRECRVYLVYGLIATVSSLSLLTYGLVHAGGYLIDRHDPWALLLLTSYAGLRTGRRYRRLFKQPTPRLVPDEEMAPRDGGSTHPPLQLSKKPPRSWKRPILWATVVAGVVPGLFLVQMPLRISGPFLVLPDANADVRTQVEGIVEEMRVHEGDSVRAGDVIARISDRDIRTGLLQAEAQVREARANLQKLEAGPTADSIAVAANTLRKAEDAAVYARENLARSKALRDREVLSVQEYETAQQQAAAAENELVGAQSEMRMLRDGNRSEDIAAARAELDRLEAQRQRLAAQLQSLDVVSPATGVVATPDPELKAVIGQLAPAGALIAKVYDVTSVTAPIVVTEKDIGDVRVGQPVVLRSRAFPDAVFHGTVTAIATAAQGIPTEGAAAAPGKSPAVDANTVRTFLVTTRIENRDRRLKPGMTGLAKVVGDKRRVIDLIRRRLAHTFRVEFWSWW